MIMVPGIISGQAEGRNLQLDAQQALKSKKECKSHSSVSRLLLGVRVSSAEETLSCHMYFQKQALSGILAAAAQASCALSLSRAEGNAAFASLSLSHYTIV